MEGVRGRPWFPRWWGCLGAHRTSDSGGPQEREGGCAILKNLGQGRTGRDAAALVHVGVGVLEGRPVGALHGHHLLVGPGLLAAGAAALPGLRLHGVPADARPSGPPHLPGLPAPGLSGVRRHSDQFPECSGLLVLAWTALWAAENPRLPQSGPSLSQTSSSNLPTMADPSSGNLPWAIQPGLDPSSCLFCLGSQLAVAWFLRGGLCQQLCPDSPAQGRH